MPETPEEQQLRSSFAHLQISQPAQTKNQTQNQNRASRESIFDPSRNRKCKYCNGDHWDRDCPLRAMEMLGGNLTITETTITVPEREIKFEFRR